MKKKFYISSIDALLLDLGLELDMRLPDANAVEETWWRIPELPKWSEAILRDDSSPSKEATIKYTEYRKVILYVDERGKKFCAWETMR